VAKPASPSIQVAKTYGSDLKLLPDLFNNTEGACNLYSSAHDLMLFSALYLGTENGKRPILSGENTALVLNSVENTAFNPLFASSASYAFGWYRLPNDGGHKTMWHEGGMPGASSFIMLIPDERISVAAITNVADKNELIEMVANELIKVVLPSFRPEALNATANYKPYDNQPEFAGKWTGVIHVQDRELPCTLTFGPTGELHIAYTEASATKAQEATFRGIVNGKSFIGSFAGGLPSDDLQHEPPQLLVLHLIREESVLSGRIAAYSAGTKRQYMYPFYIRLQRVSSQYGDFQVGASAAPP
jgi:hypothetical protein